MRALFFLAFAESFGACTTSRHHGIPLDSDAGAMAMRDAGVDTSAPPLGAWRLVPTQWSMGNVGFMGNWVVGGAPVIAVFTDPEDTCDHPGPVLVERQGSNRIVVSAFHWREPGGPCVPFNGPFERTAVLGSLDVPGAWELAAPEGTRLDFQVSGAVGSPPPAQPRGAECMHTAQCAPGTLCMPLGSPTPVSCEVPCSAARDEPSRSFQRGLVPDDIACAHGEICGSSPERCMPRVLDGCMSYADCPDSATCSAEGDFYVCEWREDVLTFAGGACASDADCTHGLACVDVDGVWSCELICASADQACPGASSCVRSTSGSSWICSHS